jgi:hypothetical protein
LLWQAGRQPSCASDVEGLLPHLGDTAGDHLLDLISVDLCTPQEILENDSKETGRMDAAQRAKAAAEGGPDRIDDQHLLHYSIIEY